MFHQPLESISLLFADEECSLTVILERLAHQAIEYGCSSVEDLRRYKTVTKAFDVPNAGLWIAARNPQGGKGLPGHRHLTCQHIESGRDGKLPLVDGESKEPPTSTASCAEHDRLFPRWGSDRSSPKQ